MASVRKSLLWGGIAFGVVLAAIIGFRLDQAALAVVVGLTCGVGASIPVSLLIVSVLNKRATEQTGGKPRRPPAAPPVYIVTPQTQLKAGGLRDWPEEYALPAPRQRRFSIIGEEEMEEL
jgi:hypothetical protein